MNNHEIVSQLRKHTVHPGAWLSIGAPVISELVTHYPFEWVLFDMEHSYITEEKLFSNLQAATRDGLALIVRPGKFDPAFFGRILDWGAAGIMMPHINSAKEATECIQAMRYPPEGIRGYSGSARVYDFGLKPGPKAGEVSPPFFIAQIESEEAVNKADAIAAVEGVDALFIGPADLKWDLNSRNQYSAEYFDDLLQRVAAVAKNHGKQIGIVTKSTEEFRHYADKGFTFISFSSDMQFLKNGFQKIAGLTASK